MDLINLLRAAAPQSYLVLPPPRANNKANNIADNKLYNAILACLEVGTIYKTRFSSKLPCSINKTLHNLQEIL